MSHTPVQDAGGVMLNNVTVAAIKGVTFSSPSTYLFAWGTNSTFANQETARLAFLTAIATVPS